ncbi:MAG: hypothetical protein ACTSVY_11550 [Candidatus Helarchaeota archaeon]
MENVKKWFEDFYEKSDTGKEIIEQIILGLTQDGFDESQLSNWIDSELESMKKVVSSKFKKEENAKD